MRSVQAAAAPSPFLTIVFLSPVCDIATLPGFVALSSSNELEPTRQRVAKPQLSAVLVSFGVTGKRLVMSFPWCLLLSCVHFRVSSSHRT